MLTRTSHAHAHTRRSPLRGPEGCDRYRPSKIAGLKNRDLDTTRVHKEVLGRETLEKLYPARSNHGHAGAPPSAAVTAAATAASNARACVGVPCCAFSTLCRCSCTYTYLRWRRSWALLAPQPNKPVCDGVYQRAVSNRNCITRRDGACHPQNA